MTGFWHPLSAVYLREPRVLASPVMVRMLLAGEGRAEIVYAGDRMWPAIRHGEQLELAPAHARPAVGEIVLAADRGVLDLVRVASAGEGVRVAADADPGAGRVLGRDDLLGRVPDAARWGGPGRRPARIWLDLVEAVSADADLAENAAATVLEKYDSQAGHYAALPGEALEPALGAWMVDRLPRGGAILVAGSGSGREAFALEDLGFHVSGIDFSPRMTEHAQAEAVRRSSQSKFAAADLRSHEEPAGSLDAILFTYDVFSFVPQCNDRIALLTRMRRWLGPRGALFLSARRVRGMGDRVALTLQWLGRAARGRHAEWGDSHTRWLDGGGGLRRSFVHVFTDRALDREAARAGFVRSDWRGGHGLFEPAVTGGAW